MNVEKPLRVWDGVLKGVDVDVEENGVRWRFGVATAVGGRCCFGTVALLGGGGWFWGKHRRNDVSWL